MTIAGEKIDMASKSPIQKFYSGQSIFITGATGFVGMLLVEKLLRTCYDLSMIYLLIRPKKGLDPKQRLDKIFADMVYDRLKEEVPKYRDKVTLVEGDCTLPGLGMSAADKEMLQREISIVFHAAASVTLDTDLRTSVVTNVYSTKEIMEMCKDMPKLEAVIYVSTAFCNSFYSTVEEKFYEPPMTYKNIINIVENLSAEMLERIKKELLGQFPGSYVFSKCISEHIVQDYGKDLPAGVFRPSMIVGTYKEPIEGWMNNIYGSIGLAVGICLGVLRCTLGSKYLVAENVPADYTINALLSTAWDVANKKQKGMDPLVYNYTTLWNTAITWQQLKELTLKHCETMPSTKAVWYPTFIITKCWYYNMILRICMHLIPAFFIDGALIIIGKKPMLLRLYRKVHKFIDGLSYYGSKEAYYPKQNVINLWDSLNQQDQKLFYFSMQNFDWDNFVRISIQSGRKNITREDPSTIPQGKKRYQILKILHYTLKYIFLSLLAFYLFRMVQYFWL